MAYVQFTITQASKPDRIKRVIIQTGDPEATVAQIAASGWRVLEYEEKIEKEIEPNQLLAISRNTALVQSGWTTGPKEDVPSEVISIISTANGAAALSAERSGATPATHVGRPSPVSAPVPVPGNDLEAAVRHAATAAQQGVDVSVTFTRSDGPNHMNVTVKNSADRQRNFYLLIGVIAAALIVLIVILSKL
jgi:hypothetical protein